MKSYLFKISSVPYKLEATANGRGFQFCNTSKERLKHIQLGCVKSKKNEIFILTEREIEKWDNDPKSEETEICSLWMGHHGFFPVDECKKGKLALIEVAFEDGTTWKLKE